MPLAAVTSVKRRSPALELVAVEPGAQRQRLLGREDRVLDLAVGPEHRALHQEDVEIAVVVVVEERAAGAHHLGVVEPAGHAVEVMKRDADLVGDVGERRTAVRGESRRSPTCSEAVGEQPACSPRRTRAPPHPPVAAPSRIGFDRDRLKLRLTFHHSIELVDGDLLEHLRPARLRPAHDQLVDHRGAAEADLLLEARRAERPAAADRDEHRPRPAVLRDLRLDAPAEAGPVGAAALEAQRDPVARRPWILEQRVGELVAGIEAAELLEEVLVAVVVEVAPGHAVPFGQDAEAAGERDLDEALAADVLVHLIRHEAREVGLAGAEVEVEPAVVVEVAVVGAHGHRRTRDPELPRDFDEAPAVVAPEHRVAVGELRAEVRRRHLRRLLAVVRVEEIEIAVVVVVEEPGGERLRRRLPQPQLGSHVGEGAVAVVAVETIVAEVGDEEIGIAVVVVVAPGDGLGEADVLDARLLRHLGEAAGAVVLEELRRVEVLARRLGADVEVEVAVAVVVLEVGGLRRIDAIGEARGRGDVDEPPRGPIEVVAQERLPDLAGVVHPGAAQHQDVDVAVVVVVGVDQVETAELRGEAPLLRDVLEPALAVVAKARIDAHWFQVEVTRSSRPSPS